MKSLRIALLLATAFLAGAVWAVDPLQIDPHETFTGPAADTSVMTVELSNDGPDARGSLTVTSQSAQTEYPVELPRGSRKQILTLPGQGYEPIEFALRTNQGTVTKSVPGVYMGSNDQPPALMIGDDEGAMAFLRRQSNDRKTVTANDVYVAPESAPGRGAAYHGFVAVVLGPGAERITDEAVTALKNYVLEGGTLIFVGGASSPTLSDRRWSDTVTGNNWQPTTVERLDALAAAANEPLTGPLTILQPTSLTPGTTVYRDGATIFETDRGFGLGKVVVLGYNPFDRPLTTWPGRARALLRYIRSGTSLVAGAFLDSVRGQVGNYSLTIPSRGPGIPAPVPMAAIGAQSNEDPFDTQLPALTTVFGMLILYFVLVVPVNFLVLRKLRRGELAWITAPLLSLVFAGLLFRSAQSLYAASLSTATQGVLVVQQGTDQALYTGRAQLFFPRGGTYDLGLKNVDRVEPVIERTDGYGFVPIDSSRMNGFNLVDNGEIVAPKFEASNLAFRQAGFTQQVSVSDWVQVTGGENGKYQVRNRSPYDLSEVVLARGDRLSPQFTVPAGGDATVRLEAGDRLKPDAQLADDDLRRFTRKTGRVAVMGIMAGFRPGPQLGTEVLGRTRNRLFFLSDEVQR